MEEEPTDPETGEQLKQALVDSVAAGDIGVVHIEVEANVEAQVVAVDDAARVLGTHHVETGEQSYLGGRVVDSRQAGHIEVVQPQLHDSEEYPPGQGANFHQIKALKCLQPDP